MSYTPSYEKPYPEGFKNEPIETTPITAEVFNGYDDAIENIENYLAEGEMGTVVIANPDIEGTEPNLTALQVGEDKFKIPSGGGASSAEDVSYDNSVTEIEATNVQDAIDSVFISVSNGKTLIADAITDKGIETSATDTFAIMAEHIGQISGGGGVSDVDIIDMQYSYKTNYNKDTFDIPLKNVEGVDKIIIHTYKNYPAEYECTAQLWFASDDTIVDYDKVLNENETQYKEWSYYIFTVNRDVTPDDYFRWRNLSHNSGSEFRAVIAYVKCSGGGSGDDKNATYYDITYKENVYINENNGSEVPETSSHATDFLDIGNYNHMFAYHVDSWVSKFYNAFYDENKIFIKNFNVNNWSYVEIPENAKYCRLSTTSNSICKVVAFTE